MEAETRRGPEDAACRPHCFRGPVVTSAQPSPIGHAEAHNPAHLCLVAVALSVCTQQTRTSITTRKQNPGTQKTIHTSTGKNCHLIPVSSYFYNILYEAKEGKGGGNKEDKWSCSSHEVSETETAWRPADVPTRTGSLCKADTES